MILYLNKIEVCYDNVILAVHDIDLSVEEGQIVSLLGANGAGKSTCLKAISGLLSMENGKVTKGEILFNGKAVNHLPPSERAKLGICHVAEGREILKTLTVEENLKAGTLFRKDSTESIKRDYDLIYDFFPVLKDRRPQIAQTLSGGEQQMLVIARSIMMKPKVLLLDEPSLGLAPKVAESVIKEIHRINKDLGTTILLVEQNASLALPVSSKVYILTNGQVVLSCLPKDLENIDIGQYYFGKKTN